MLTPLAYLENWWTHQGRSQGGGGGAHLLRGGAVVGTCGPRAGGSPKVLSYPSQGRSVGKKSMTKQATQLKEAHNYETLSSL